MLTAELPIHPITNGILQLKPSKGESRTYLDASLIHSRDRNQHPTYGIENDNDANDIPSFLLFN